MTLVSVSDSLWKVTTPTLPVPPLAYPFSTRLEGYSGGPIDLFGVRDRERTRAEVLRRVWNRSAPGLPDVWHAERPDREILRRVRLAPLFGSRRRRVGFGRDRRNHASSFGRDRRNHASSFGRAPVGLHPVR